MAEPPRHPLLTRPSAALVWLAALVALPYGLPARWSTVPLPAGCSLSLRLLSPPEAPLTPAPAPEDEAPPPVGAVLLVEAPMPEAPAPAAAPFAPGGAPFAPGAAALKTPEKLDGKGVFLDPTGQALSGLFERLRRVEAREAGARARVLFYGDSIVAFDQVTETLRRRFIDRFGDGGRGFVLPVSPWMGYYQSDVARFPGSRWMVSRVVGPTAPDNRYGLGGVAYQSSGEAMALLGTATRGNHCKTASRFVLSYAAHPGGGELRYQIDGGPLQAVSTRAPQPEDRFEEIEVPDGPHKLTIHTHGGPVRFYGVEMLRDTPGATLDALGVIGARMRHLAQFDDEAWGVQLKRRDPALVVVGLGINDVSDGVRLVKAFDDYETFARDVLQRIHRHVPRAACLIMGPLDRGAGSNDPFTSKGIAARVNVMLKRTALAQGCAYLDVFSLMGGAGGMAEWVQKGLGSADYMHPSPRGAELLGNLLADEIFGRYDASKAAPASSSP